MDRTIIQPFQEIQYKIYGYTLPEVPSHEGYVKIGETTRDAVTRVFEQVGTVGLNPNIIFEKLARKSDGTWFRDKELHRYLRLQGIEKKDFNNRADEWFYFNGYLEKAEQLTDQFIQQDYDASQTGEDFEYILRNEQQQAVEKTLEYYHSGKEPREFLWNAKPRFGKTLTTYDFIRNLNVTNVLIVTNRPAIANSWFDDFHKFIASKEPHMKFVSETDALNGKAMTREEYRQFLNTTSYEYPAQITFISLQDLKGAQFAGGNYEKLEWVPGLEWDLLVIDEAHEGVDTMKTDRAFSRINRKFTLHLSGTPFKALANDKFSEEQIFNWSYIDEQEAKQKWDPLLGSNPYERLPTLNLFTYQMSKLVEDEVAEGMTIAEDHNVDYAFDLNEFFSVKDNGTFEYEASVEKFLNNLASGKFPFAKEAYRAELNHTFWLLPRVNAAKALEKLLNKHPVFKQYKVILAAGDGISLHEGVEQEALNYKANTKSFDRVREAIKKYDKTITLSVGQLTTGVTIPEWTAVFMLNNIQSPSLYFQAAFRAQNPYEYEKDGAVFRKENAYIFDFSPNRTLQLYEKFANNLSGIRLKTTEEKKRNIKKLLNFFPVIAEDEQGVMHEIDATEVLTIPTKITSKEVVNRGFMSNLLFANISGIFSGHLPFKEILDKIPPEKNKRLDKRREVNVTTPQLNEDGEVSIPTEMVIGTAKDLFGEKIYAPVEDEAEVLTALDFFGKKEQKQVIEQFADTVTETFSDGFDQLKNSFALTKRQTEQIKKSVQKSLEQNFEEKSFETAQKIREVEKEFVAKVEEAEKEKNEEKLETIQKQYEAQKEAVEKEFQAEINAVVKQTLNDVVEEQMEKVEEKKKKTTEDDVRDHLRGFARTIPAFLMAYGDGQTNLTNFEENIDEATFEELTSITKAEFRQLRDGFEYITDNGEAKRVPGLFNEVVFNASIKEFMETKERLANYFDESLQEDIFDYIPPQKTNQIFTPRDVVKKMVDLLEAENPAIFKDKTIKFADLYAKSGLYITEVVKKLNEGLKAEIPDQDERIKWILENQVYVCAPSDIIYHIVRNFIFGSFDYLLNVNIKLLDTLKLLKEGNLSKKLFKEFGDNIMKFDVIIGNPPYQEEDGGARSSAKPVYHKFIEESISLNPDLITFITPSRWFSGGKGLDEFREKMIKDKRMKVLVDYPDAAECFPNTEIKGGVNYFLWDRNYEGTCKVVNVSNDKVLSVKERYLQEDNLITFVRYNSAIDILRKVNSVEEINTENSFANLVSFRQPFGLPTNFNEYKESITNENDLKVYMYKKIGYVNKEQINRNEHWIDAHKVYISMAYGAGEDYPHQIINKPFYGEPNSICTETYLLIGPFPDKKTSENVISYMNTKFFRFLVLLLKNTQHATKKVYDLVPVQDFTRAWTDDDLYKKYNLDDEDIKFIESMIKPMN